MRPATLAEVAELVMRGEAFDRCLANFLDEFYAKPGDGALAETPPLLAARRGLNGQIEDAYLAATAEELARVYHLRPPRWTGDDTRALHRPWFASSLAALRAMLIFESPPAFRARNLFVSENALARA